MTWADVCEYCIKTFQKKVRPNISTCRLYIHFFYNKTPFHNPGILLVGHDIVQRAPLLREQFSRMVQEKAKSSLRPLGADWPVAGVMGTKKQRRQTTFRLTQQKRNFWVNYTRGLLSGSRTLQSKQQRLDAEWGIHEKSC